MKTEDDYARVYLEYFLKTRASIKYPRDRILEETIVDMILADQLIRRAIDLRSGSVPLDAYDQQIVDDISKMNLNHGEVEDYSLIEKYNLRLLNRDFSNKEKEKLNVKYLHAYMRKKGLSVSGHLKRASRGHFKTGHFES